MLDTEKKFSLLNDLDNIIEQEGNIISSYIFNDISKIIINDLYISIPTNSSLRIGLENGYMTIEVLSEIKGSFSFKIECKALKDFYLLF